MKKIKKEFVLLLLMLFSVGGVIISFITLDMGFGDFGHYLKMSEYPGNFVGSPWGYRIAIPYLVAIFSSMGTSIKITYTIVQIAMYSSFLTVLYLWISKEFQVNKFAAIGTCVLFMFSFPGVYNLHNVIHIGFSEYFFILLGCIAIYNNHLIFLIIIIVLSSFVKESVPMLLIPTYFVSSLIMFNWKSTFLKTSLLVLIFMAIFIFLRSGFLFKKDVDINTYTSFYNLEYMLFVYEYWGGLFGAVRKIIGTFGPIWLLSIIGFYISSKRLKGLMILPFLAILQIVLATDIWRMVGVGAPMVLVFAALTLNRLDKTSIFFIVIISSLNFLCFNFDTFAKLSLIISIIITGILLFINRKLLLKSI